MLKIYPVETEKDIEIAKNLFSEFDDFLKEQLREYNNFPWAVKYWQSLEEEVKGLPGRYATPSGCILIAEYNNKHAGCVGLVEENSEVCIMKRLYVRQEFRGLGIGKSLVGAIIECAHIKDYEIMRLHTNLLLNIAISLYKKIGFKKIAHNKRYPDQIKDLIIHMELKLTESDN
jgi:GNAT superfamily N-acetyltransferase